MDFDLKTFSVSSSSRDELIDITSQIDTALAESGINDGICVVFIPHTTAAVTINEDADPAVKHDILKELDKIVPHNDAYTHAEGNSAAHIKASMIGASETILVSEGRLVLGTWQSVYFCEFDGPRNRKMFVSIMASAGNGEDLL